MKNVENIYRDIGGFNMKIDVFKDLYRKAC